MTDDIKKYGCVMCPGSYNVYPSWWCTKYQKEIKRNQDGKLRPVKECEEGKK